LPFFRSTNFVDSVFNVFILIFFLFNQLLYELWILSLLSPVLTWVMIGQRLFNFFPFIFWIVFAIISDPLPISMKPVFFQIRYITFDWAILPWIEISAWNLRKF
jgi:hypothetical protein